MVTDATKKSRKAPPAASPGKRKPRKPQRGPEASPLGAGSEELPSDPEGASLGEKIKIAKIAEVPGGEKLEDSKGSDAPPVEHKKKENQSDPEGEDKKKSESKRKNKEVEIETPEDERMKRHGQNDREPSGKEVALNSDGGPSHKKGTFERVWSKEDEMKLLQALIDCQEEYGVDPSSSIDLIHRHIRVSQHMQFSRSQVYEKIRRLKQKFEATVTKMRSNHPGSIKPHDQAMFELSQKIWTTEQVAPPVTAMGNECTGVGVSLPHPYLRDAVSQLEKESAYYAGAGSITKGFQLLKPSEAEKLEERWRAHCSASMKIFFETCKLKNELLQACIQALESHTP
ncbi:unnamed protein product [Spirodela intermedia]|uniref:Glabrous enhancer-binding protein-like DBD domain-containing protein n=1 Tax=Spirodela intermedia TaxID=51605 RepID=A0A7I8KFL1_SPIIN|nr:unnamed protein product [Spirodela intermedia]